MMWVGTVYSVQVTRQEGRGKGSFPGYTSLCYSLCIGKQIAKPEVISLLEQGEEPWLVEHLYPQSTCPGESGPQVGVRNIPPSSP